MEGADEEKRSDRLALFYSRCLAPMCESKSDPPSPSITSKSQEMYLFVANIHVHPPDILEPLAIRCQIIAVSCGVQSHLASGQWKEYGLNITFVRQERCNIISTRWSLLAPVLLKRVRSVPNPNVVPHQLLLLDLTKGVERHIKGPGKGQIFR